MSNLLDTFLNVVAFAFIGLLVWLYFKPVEPDGNETDAPSKDSA